MTVIDQSIVKLLSIVLYVITYNTWFIFRAHGIHGVFYKGIAAACLLVYIAFTLPVKYQKLNDKLNTVCVICALSNVLDELFFNPTAFQWNEYIAVSLILIFVFRGKPDKRVFKSIKGQ